MGGGGERKTCRLLDRHRLVKHNNPNQSWIPLLLSAWCEQLNKDKNSQITNVGKAKMRGLEDSEQTIKTVIPRLFIPVCVAWVSS